MLRLTRGGAQILLLNHANLHTSLRVREDSARVSLCIL